MKIAVTRLHEKDEGTSNLFNQYGLEAVIIPTIQSQEPSDTSSIDNLIENIKSQKIDILIFTSTLGVLKFFNKIADIPRNIRIISVGPKTAQKVIQFGHHTEVLDSYNSRHFAEYIGKYAPDKTIGIARANVPDPGIVNTLESLGATVIEGTCYELVETPNKLKNNILNKNIDCVVFTSTKSFLASKLASSDVRDVITVAIGPKTAENMEKHGVTADLIGSGTLDSCAVLLKNLNNFK
ncbi:MAG: uroporphyrinogen-III synthase [Methanohalobium sp.]|uniref:uroporphyrinogen-III synthase n=1 Tax=Methanohalobium sp. TaxID=2837493 RepID=UPI00397AA178